MTKTKRVKTEKTSEEAKYTCEICGFKTSSLKGFKGHMRLAHARPVINEIRTLEIQKALALAREELKKVINESIGASLSDYTKELTKVLEALEKISTKLTKPETKLFKCKNCGFTTDNPQSYLEHVAGDIIEKEIQSALNQIDWGKVLTKKYKDEIYKIIEEAYDVKRKEERKKDWLW